MFPSNFFVAGELPRLAEFATQPPGYRMKGERRERQFRDNKRRHVIPPDVGAFVRNGSLEQASVGGLAEKAWNQNSRRPDAYQQWACRF